MSNNTDNIDSVYNLNKNKQTIYWDVDDVILNSSEVAINIINNKYNKVNEKSNFKNKKFEDIKDWGLKSIWRGINKDIIQEIFESDDFWNQIKIREEFKKTFDSIYTYYNHILVTKGTVCNHDRKSSFLINDTYMSEKEWGYKCIKDNQSKNIINMKNGIFIDDNIENLITTNARIKILLKNGIETNYNTFNIINGKIDLEDIYIEYKLEEVEQLLKFNVMNYTL